MDISPQLLVNTKTEATKRLDSGNEDTGTSTADVEGKSRDHHTHQPSAQDGFPPSPYLEGAGT